MKKNTIVLITMVLSLLLFSSAGYADSGDRHEDGKIQINEAQMMIEKGKMMQKCTFDDKAAMVKEGKVMISEGTKMVQNGMMSNSTDGSSHLQEMGSKMTHAGKLLVKKGNQKEPLTEEDKKMIKKQGENLEAIGTRFLKGGNLM